MAKGPKKIDSEHCEKLRKQVANCQARLKVAKTASERQGLREQIRILGDQIAEDCTDAKFKPSKDR